MTIWTMLKEHYDLPEDYSVKNVQPHWYSLVTETGERVQMEILPFHDKLYHVGYASESSTLYIARVN